MSYPLPGGQRATRRASDERGEGGVRMERDPDTTLSPLSFDESPSPLQGEGRC